jgi:hypothetical protein
MIIVVGNGFFGYDETFLCPKSKKESSITMAFVQMPCGNPKSD